MLPNIENFQSEVSSFYEKVREQLDLQKTFNDIYKGYFVFMSPIYETCEIMFIGINPGIGGGGTIEKVEPDAEFDYLKHDYSLARETIKVFKQIDKMHILEGNAIKTNLYYLATTNQSEIRKNVNLLDKDLQSKFYENSKKWTKELISIFKPKLIICEGAYVYNTLLEMYPTASLDYSEKGCVVVDDKNYDFKLIGYSRFRSNIRNKKGLAELLKRYI